MYMYMYNYVHCITYALDTQFFFYNYLHVRRKWLHFLWGFGAHCIDIACVNIITTPPISCVSGVRAMYYFTRHTAHIYRQLHLPRWCLCIVAHWDDWPVISMCTFANFTTAGTTTTYLSDLMGPWKHPSVTSTTVQTAHHVTCTITTDDQLLCIQCMYELD